MTISLRINEAEMNLIRQYANINNISVSDLVRNAVMDKIEDEYDLKAYQAALAEYKANPTTYTYEQVVQELGLTE